MDTVKPEIIRVLIDDENLRRDLISQRGLPFSHQRFVGTDDAHGGVSVADQFAIQFAAPLASAIIGHAVDAGTVAEARRQARVAGHQIDAYVISVSAAKSAYDAFDNGPRPALDQQDGRDVRLAAGEEISHWFDYMSDFRT